MKKFFLIIIVFLSIAPVFFGQEKNIESEKIDTLKNTEGVSDEGHWFGIRFGVQTKPDKVKYDWKFSEWWTLFAAYEYRFDKTWSVLAEYHLFREKRCADCRTSSNSDLEFIIKLRFKIANKLKLSLEGGVAIGAISWTGLELPYGGGLGIELNNSFTLLFSVKTFVVPDYGYWASVGLSYKIFN